MIRRTGMILVVMTIMMAGCRKGENPQTTMPTTNGGAAASSAQQPPASSPLRAPTAAGPRRILEVDAPPLVGLTWIKGGPVTITPGTVYVVEFWATWCGPCKFSIPHLTELQKKYKDKGVVFVGVSDEPPEVTTPFVKQMGDKMDYNVASDTKGSVTSGYMVAFRQEGIPTAFVVNAAGKIIWIGHPMTAPFEQAIDQALATKSAPAAH